MHVVFQVGADTNHFFQPGKINWKSREGFIDAVGHIRKNSQGVVLFNIVTRPANAAPCGWQPFTIPGKALTGIMKFRKQISFLQRGVADTGVVGYPVDMPRKKGYVIGIRRVYQGVGICKQGTFCYQRIYKGSSRGTNYFIVSLIFKPDKDDVVRAGHGTGIQGGIIRQVGSIFFTAGGK